MCKARSRKDSGCSGWRCGRWKNKHRPTAQASRSNDCNTKIPRAGRTNRRTARQSSTLSGCSPANHKTWRDSAHFWARNTYFLLLHQHCGGAAGCSQAADCGTLHRNKYLFDNVVCPLATSVGHEADSTSIALLQTKVWLILHGVATVLDHPQARGRGRKGGSATERRARPISQSRSIRPRCDGRGQRQCCRQDQHAASHPVDARAQRPMEFRARRCGGIFTTRGSRTDYVRGLAESFLKLTPVAGLIFETKNRAIFLERIFGRGITAREQVSRAVILEKF